MTNLSAISPHAVMRYLERVMRLAVTPECWTIHDAGQRMNAALMACRAHGLTVDQVREMMLGEVPMIGVMITAAVGQTKIVSGDFAYVIRDGRLVTVVDKWMNDDRARHLNHQTRSRKEGQREAHKTQRRFRKLAKVHQRRQREDA